MTQWRSNEGNSAMMRTLHKRTVLRVGKFPFCVLLVPRMTRNVEIRRTSELKLDGIDSRIGRDIHHRERHLKVAKIRLALFGTEEEGRTDLLRSDPHPHWHFHGFQVIHTAS